MGKFEMPDFLSRYQQEPFRKPDCNYCCWLNLTELEQENVYEHTIFTEHACMLYGKRLRHGSVNIGHDPKIYPCEECERDNYEGMKPRKDRYDEDD